MGNSTSDSSSRAAASLDPYQQQKCGYRILGVQPNSPLLQGTTSNGENCVGITLFFDFLVAINDVPLKALDSTLVDMLLNNEDKSTTITIYNTKNCSSRQILVIPTRHWTGEGLLGATIRFDFYYSSPDTNPLEDGGLLKILHVEEDSPASKSGLLAGEYLLGTPEVVFSSVESLQLVLSQNIDAPMDLYTYNTTSDEVGVVTIVPQRDKLLGAELGTGFLHRIPSPLLATPGSTATSRRGFKADVSPFGVAAGDGWTSSSNKHSTAAENRETNTEDDVAVEDQHAPLVSGAAASASEVQSS